MALSSFKEPSFINLRPTGLQITMLLLFEIIGHESNYGKNFPKLCQTSFSGFVNLGHMAIHLNLLSWNLNG